MPDCVVYSTTYPPTVRPTKVRSRRMFWTDCCSPTPLQAANQSGRRGAESAPSSQMLRYLRRVDDLTTGKLRSDILNNGAQWRYRSPDLCLAWVSALATGAAPWITATRGPCSARKLTTVRAHLYHNGGWQWTHRVAAWFELEFDDPVILSRPVGADAYFGLGRYFPADIGASPSRSAVGSCYYGGEGR